MEKAGWNSEGSLVMEGSQVHRTNLISPNIIFIKATISETSWSLSNILIAYIDNHRRGYLGMARCFNVH